VIIKGHVELDGVHVEWDQDEGITGAWLERDGKTLDLLDFLTKEELYQLESQAAEWESLEAERIQCAAEDAADARREERLIRGMEK
jgi:hypothetical protein